MKDESLEQKNGDFSLASETHITGQESYASSYERNNARRKAQIAKRTIFAIAAATFTLGGVITAIQKNQDKGHIQQCNNGIHEGTPTHTSENFIENATWYDTDGNVYTGKVDLNKIIISDGSNSCFAFAQVEGNGDYLHGGDYVFYVQDSGNTYKDPITGKVVHFEAVSADMLIKTPTPEMNK